MGNPVPDRSTTSNTSLPIRPLTSYPISAKDRCVGSTGQNTATFRSHARRHRNRSVAVGHGRHLPSSSDAHRWFTSTTYVPQNRQMSGSTGVVSSVVSASERTPNPPHD